MACFWLKRRITPLAARHSRGKNGAMERWRVEELMELAEAVYAAGLLSFIVRRTIQRLERGEITVARAAKDIARSGIWGASCESNAPPSSCWPIQVD
jgi:hypothetical protein